MTSVILILDNIRSTHNVGSILRTADGFGVDAVYICGYTPYPSLADDTRLPHEREKLTKAIHKTALGAEKTVPIRLFSSVDAAIVAAKQAGFTIAMLEQSKHSIKLNEYQPPAKLAVVLGNEVTGILSATLKAGTITLEIPMLGKKESFNVSVSAAICLYELRRNSL